MGDRATAGVQTPRESFRWARLSIIRPYFGIRSSQEPSFGSTGTTVMCCTKLIITGKLWMS